MILRPANPADLPAISPAGEQILRRQVRSTLWREDLASFLPDNLCEAGFRGRTRGPRPLIDQLAGAVRANCWPSASSGSPATSPNMPGGTE